MDAEEVSAPDALLPSSGFPSATAGQGQLGHPERTRRWTTTGWAVSLQRNSRVSFKQT